MRVLFERGISVRNQTVLIRGVNDDTGAHAAARANASSISTCIRTTCTCTTWSKASRSCAPRSKPRSTSKSSCAARPPASTRRPSSATRRAAAASATCTRSTTTIARTASPSTPRRASSRARHFVYFDPIDTLSSDAQARWASRAIGDEMVAEAIVRAGGSRD